MDEKFSFQPRVFLWGCLGAAAPEIVKLAKLAAGATSIQISFSPLYFFLMVVFVVIGGLFANGFRPGDAWKAIYIGATFPLIISSWLS